MKHLHTLAHIRISVITASQIIATERSIFSSPIYLSLVHSPTRMLETEVDV